MPRPGAALAMWWCIAAPVRAEFQHWHTHEHFPERLSLPGFRRASRWEAADGGEGFFVLYELDAPAALVSPEYRARLDAPSDWSRRMMPHHRQMVRSPARVCASHGGWVSGHLLTLRFSPAPGAVNRLQAWLDAQARAWPMAPGLCGAHRLQTEQAAQPPTTEQRIRGLADRTADGILLVSAYDDQALQALRAGALSDAALAQAGAADGAEAGLYRLCASLETGELR